MEHDARCELKNEYIGVPRWANTCRCQERALEVDLAAVGAAMQAVQEEKDALRLRVAALEANLIDALNMVCKEGNSAYDCAVALTDVVTRSKGDTTALRAMLVEAALDGLKGIGYGSREADMDMAYFIADRILGASKEGGE